MSLGRFRLDGIPAAPRGLPQIEVTFDIDANGIINVTARDKATGKEQKVVITASTNLNKSDIDRMVEEAKKHQSEDSRRKELVEARNNADSTVYQVEKQIKDLGDKLPAVDKSRIEEKIQEVKTVMQKDDLQVIRSKTEELTQMLGAVSAQANAQTRASRTNRSARPHHRRMVMLSKANSKRHKSKGCGENHSLFLLLN